MDHDAQQRGRPAEGVRTGHPVVSGSRPLKQLLRQGLQSSLHCDSAAHCVSSRFAAYLISQTENRGEKLLRVGGRAMTCT